MTKRNKISAKPDFSNWNLPTAKLTEKWFKKALADVIHTAAREKLYMTWLVEDNTDFVEVYLPFGDISENFFVTWRINIKKDLQHEIESYRCFDGTVNEGTKKFFREQEARFTKYAKLFADACEKESK